MAGVGPVELLVLGRVPTLEGAHGFGWVEALAVGEGRVLAAGRRADVEPLAGSGTRRLVLDPARHVVLPGLTDAHLHLVAAAVAEEELDLTRAPDAGAVLAAVAEAHRARAESGDRDGWLLGRGWAVERLGAWPTAEALESVAPGRPIALWSHDHHARWVSSAALALAGIGAATADPPGGTLRRDGRGLPTGVLHEHSAKLVDRAIPERDDEAAARAVEAYGRRLWAWGIVGCHDPGEGSPELALRRGPVLLGRLAAEGRLPVRVHACVRAEQLDRAVELGLRSGDGVDPADPDDPGLASAAARFRVGWLKHFADGTLGSATAALLAPYEGLSDEALPSGPAGGLLLPPEELAADLRRAALAGLVPMVHAIGDRAVRVALDAIEASMPEVRAAHGGALPLLPRLEHVQLLDPTDRPRFGALGVAASIQPAHLRTDTGPARRLWGRRAEHSYPCRSLLEAGAVVALGTDAPVEPADPWPGIALGVTRRHAEWGRDAGPFLPGEGISLAQAIRAAARAPAMVAGQADSAGHLGPGALADLIVLEAAVVDETPDPAGPLARARSLLTLIDGQEVHRDPAFDA